MRDRTAPDPNWRALVVEDDPVTREFLAEALAQAGWTVATAATLAIALARIRDWIPQLVLCDVRLPDGDAFALATELGLGDRAGIRKWHTIALSADIDTALRARLIDAGYDQVLAKPLAIGDLLAALRAAESGLRPGSCHIEARPAHGVREHRPAISLAHAAILDDDAALHVCGNRNTVESLRRLFAEELPGCLEQLRQAHATDDGAAKQEILHRLRSASGFCGASAFALAVREASNDRLKGALGAAELSKVLREGHALLELLARRGAQ